MWDKIECEHVTREESHEERGPAGLNESNMSSDGKRHVCQCGLSDSKPLCDGSHSAAADEADGVVYKYENDGDEGKRREIDEIVYDEE